VVASRPAEWLARRTPKAARLPASPFAHRIWPQQRSAIWESTWRRIGSIIKADRFRLWLKEVGRSKSWV